MLLEMFDLRVYARHKFQISSIAISIYLSIYTSDKKITYFYAFFVYTYIIKIYYQKI